MRVLGLDFETTGFDYQKNDRITEIGAIVWEVETSKPLALYSELLYEETYPPQSDEIIRITGITNEMLREFGVHPALGFARLASLVKKHAIEYIVAHNGENFDKPFLGAELIRHAGAIEADGHPAELAALQSTPWIDTRTDIPYAVEPGSRKLAHLALDCGFINPFPHRAVFDVASMMKVMSATPFADIVEFQKIPWAVMRAVVEFKDKDLAKAQRYSWEQIGDKKYPKWWVKKVKLNMMDAEIETGRLAGFPVIRVE